MQKEYQFTDEQYTDYTSVKDRLAALHLLGIETANLAEPTEQVHEKIFSAHRAGHNTIEVAYTISASPASASLDPVEGELSK